MVETCDTPQSETECTPDREQTFKETCATYRSHIKDIGNSVKTLMGNYCFGGDQDYSGQYNEMKANIMLAYRHLEDARMRIGKVLQAADDGVSILDK